MYADLTALLSSSSSADAPTVQFKYSVTWVANPEASFAHRLDRYKSVSFFPQQGDVHWLAILNSVIVVLLLTGFLFLILVRVLRNDFAQFHADHDGYADECTSFWLVSMSLILFIRSLAESEDFGWKLIHDQVFRFPPHRMLLSNIAGMR